jgi:hypothetical protein
MIVPRLLLNTMEIHLPNLDELSLRVVLALPNASIKGLASRICCWIWPTPPASSPRLEISARYDKNTLVASVLPAPDSPATMHDWFA